MVETIIFIYFTSSEVFFLHSEKISTTEGMFLRCSKTDSSKNGKKKVLVKSKFEKMWSMNPIKYTLYWKMGSSSENYRMSLCGQKMNLISFIQCGENDEFYWNFLFSLFYPSWICCIHSRENFFHFIVILETHSLLRWSEMSTKKNSCWNLILLISVFYCETERSDE